MEQLHEDKKASLSNVFILQEEMKNYWKRKKGEGRNGEGMSEQKN